MTLRYYNENYVVNEYGELFSLYNHKIKKLRPYINARGYIMYRLSANGKTIHKPAHHLSYWVNIGPFDTSDGLQIDHIDGNKRNNYYKNLRRVTPRDNANNINTAPELKPSSRSGYRLTNQDGLPSKYIKSKVFEPDEFERLHKCNHNNNNNRNCNCGTVKHNHCEICGELTNGKLCLNCYKDKKSARIPSKDELVKDLKSGEPLIKLASKYDISDNAYRKWLRKRGLPTKSKEIKSFILSV